MRYYCLFVALFVLFTYVTSSLSFFHEVENLVYPKAMKEQHKQRIIQETIKNRDEPLRPVIIVPSLFGNQLQAQLVNSKPNYWWCSSISDWYTVWIDDNSFYPFEIDCWGENMKLEFDPRTLSSKPLQGVNIRGTDFGGLGGVTFLDIQNKTVSWGNIIDILVALGYTPGINLRAAPYDWRYGPDSEFANSFQPLQRLIEETYEINGNLTVSITSNSMGGGYFLLFLNAMTQEWKDKYIHSFVPFSSCFGGSMMSPIFLSGAPIPIIDIDLVPVTSLWASMLWLTPYTAINGDRVLFTTPSKQFTVSTLPEFLDYVGLNVSSIILKTVTKYQTLMAPHVPTYCIFGTEVPTIDEVHFETESLWKGSSTNTTVPGDGVCRFNSLDLCAVWANQQTQPSESYSIPQLQHGALDNSDSIRYFLKILNL